MSLKEGRRGDGPINCIRKGTALLALALALVCCAGRGRPPSPNAAIPKEAFAAVDAHALKAPADVEGSPEALAAYLCRPWKSETDKARALYRWITDRIDYTFETASSGMAERGAGPSSILKSRRAVCEGYSDLFAALARAAGLEAETVPGYAKGVGYEAGDSFQGRHPDHAWNAVKADGAWRLLDCTWGAGAVDPDGRYRKRFEPYYFFTPPREFLLSHYPLDSRWQLVDPAASLAEFERLPYLKAPFFRFGLTLLSHPSSVIVSEEPAVAIRVGAPPDVLLEGRLLEAGRRMERSLVETHRGRASQEISVRLPQPGPFTLRIFAAREGDRVGNFRTYEWVADYRVVKKSP